MLNNEIIFEKVSFPFTITMDISLEYKSHFLTNHVNQLSLRLLSIYVFC